MLCQDPPSLSEHVLAESIPCFCTLNTCKQILFISILTFYFVLLSEQSRKWFITYLQPASCRNRQSGTSGSSCRGAAACPSNLTPEINWTCFFTYAFFLTTHFIRREKRDFPKDDSQLWGVFMPQSDLEVFLHGFSDMCDVMRRSDQVVSGIKHRLHRKMRDPESWETERRLKSFRSSR